MCTSICLQFKTKENNKYFGLRHKNFTHICKLKFALESPTTL